MNCYYNSTFRVTDQELWVPNPNATDVDRTIEYTYDQDQLVTSITPYDGTPGGMVQSGPGMTIDREPETGKIKSTTLANVTTNQTYNSLGELASYQANYNGSALFQTVYVRDSLGRITELTETEQGQTKVMRYSYDVVGRLEKVWRNDTLISSYTYDPNGNRISHWTPTKVDSGSYDAQDRMLTYGKAQYVYSKNGELQKKIEGSDTTRYTYDYFGNLVNVRLSNGDLIEYLIDGQNRRIGKKLNGQIVKRWIYSGQLTPVAELDSAENVVAQFIGSFMIKNGNTYQLVTDHLGSVRLVVDVSTGEVAQQIEYDEFGNVTLDSNQDFQPFGFAGGLYDAQTGLTRFGARDYESSVGRWTKKDPIRFNGGQSNIHSYVGNNPVNVVDPNGLCPGDKEKCINNFLRSRYGDFVANTLVPDFSLISAYTHTLDYLKTSGVSMGIKGLT